MSQVSRVPLKRTVSEKMYRLFPDACTRCSSISEMSSFLDDLLTPTEKTMLSKRLAIAYLLLKNYSYGSIRSLLHVSSPTIGFVSLTLKRRGDGLRALLRKIHQRKRRETALHEFADAVIELIGKGEGQDWKETNRILSQRRRHRNIPL